MGASKDQQKFLVVYIITKLELGGAQKVCLALFDGLKTENIDTKLISGSEGILSENLKNNNNVIFLESFKRELNLKNIFLETKNFLNLIKKLKELKADTGPGEDVE